MQKSRWPAFWSSDQHSAVELDQWHPVQIALAHGLIQALGWCTKHSDRPFMSIPQHSHALLAFKVQAKAKHPLTAHASHSVYPLGSPYHQFDVWIWAQKREDSMLDN